MPRYGMMITGNQSWYSMSNVPSNMEERLFNYDNHQPGVGVEGFIEFPFSRRLSAQTAMSCHFFQNKSTLKDRFLLKMTQVIVGQDGHSYYHMDIDMMNPLGDYTPTINFRVSDQMAENEMIEEHIEIRQTLKTMQMNLGLNALLIDTRRIDISVGAGAGLAYTAWLDNEFNVSLYYEGRLHHHQMEFTDHMDNVMKLQLLGYSHIGLTYYANDRLGVLIQGGYQSGLTSLRNASKSNGSQTYLHAIRLSLGITKAF
jgi:hypothetical protein